MVENRVNLPTKVVEEWQARGLDRHLSADNLDLVIRRRVESTGREAISHVSVLSQLLKTAGLAEHQVQEFVHKTYGVLFPVETLK